MEIGTASDPCVVRDFASGRGPEREADAKRHGKLKAPESARFPRNISVADAPLPKDCGRLAASGDRDAHV